MRSEQDCVEAAYKVLLAQGYPSGWEVALMGCSIDLVFEIKRKVYAVEFKKRDWKRAIIQAKKNAIGVDYTFICLINKIVCDRVMEAARIAGVGIMLISTGVDAPFTLFQRSERCTPWKVMREKVRAQLSKEPK